MAKLRAFLLFPLLLLIPACSAGMRPPEGGPGAPAASAAVERFLRLANEEDYIGMGWVFGTEEGPFIQQRKREEAERWLYTLAKVLKHDSFTLSGEQPVAGRAGAAVRVDVVLRNPNEVRLPFTVVRGPQGRWYVEQFPVERLLQR